MSQGKGEPPGKEGRVRQGPAFICVGGEKPPEDFRHGGDGNFKGPPGCSLRVLETPFFSAEVSIPANTCERLSPCLHISPGGWSCS